MVTRNRALRYNRTGPQRGFRFVSEPILRAKGLAKRYPSGESILTVFESLDFSLAAGESVSVVGESGAGKSTLLHLLGALDQPSAGEVFFEGRALSSTGEDELAAYRNESVGYVWQSYDLLPEFTALENVAMPLRIAGVAPAEAESRALRRLQQTGLGERAHHQSGELSGGEQQRVALARALVHDPKVLLADEPTGNLDEKTGEAIVERILALPSEDGISVLVATHNLGFAGRCDRMLRFDHGRLVETLP